MSASSDKSVVAPFSGWRTTIDAAEKLGRDWIGIDVTQLAISLIKNRSKIATAPGFAHSPLQSPLQAGAPLWSRLHRTLSCCGGFLHATL